MYGHCPQTNRVFRKVNVEDFSPLPFIICGSWANIHKFLFRKTKLRSVHASLRACAPTNLAHFRHPPSCKDPPMSTTLTTRTDRHGFYQFRNSCWSRTFFIYFLLGVANMLTSWQNKLTPHSSVMGITIVQSQKQ